jgi:transcriptional regulator with XRE-family HTH domain
MVGTSKLVVMKTLPILLKQRRMRVTDLSRLSGVPTKTIYHWINGQTPNLIGLYKVAQALGVSIEALAFQDEMIPNQNFKYELVLYRIDEMLVREKLYRYSPNDK